MIRNQEARAKGSDDLHLVTRTQITHVVGADAAHRFALLVGEHTLDRQRQVVVAGALAIAWAGDRVLARMMRPSLGVQARRNDADRLPLQERKRHGAEVQHDVVRVVVLPDLGHANIAGHRGGDEFFCGLGAIQIGVCMRGRPGRHRGAVLGSTEFLSNTGLSHHRGRC